MFVILPPGGFLGPAPASTFLATESGLNGPATLLAPPAPVQSAAPIEALTNGDPAIAAAVGAAMTASVIANAEAIAKVAFDDVTYYQSASMVPPGGLQANQSIVGQVRCRGLWDGDKCTRVAMAESRGAKLLSQPEIWLFSGGICRL